MMVNCWDIELRSTQWPKRHIWLKPWKWTYWINAKFFDKHYYLQQMRLLLFFFICLSAYGRISMEIWSKICLGHGKSPFEGFFTTFEGDRSASTEVIFQCPPHVFNARVLQLINAELCGALQKNAVISGCAQLNKGGEKKRREQT